jgi:hypothetical protein
MCTKNSVNPGTLLTASGKVPVEIPGFAVIEIKTLYDCKWNRIENDIAKGWQRFKGAFPFLHPKDHEQDQTCYSNPYPSKSSC